MADGVPITAGSGTTIATDDTGAPGHVQLFKLAISADGSATLVPADATNGLRINGVVQPFAPLASALTGTASSTGTGDTAVIAAQGANTRICITSIAVYNDSTTNAFVNVKDGSTTRLVLPAPAKGGAMHTLPFPLRIAVNTAFNFASSAGVTTMYVSAVGFREDV